MRLDRELPDVLRSASTPRQVESIKETYRQKEQDIQSHPPHSPNMLGASAFAAFNFSFEEIETAIDNTAKKYLDEFGAFPLKAQLIGLNNFLGFTVSLKVWRD